MINFADASLNTLIAKGGHDCACGRHHEMKMDYLAIEPGAVRHIPEALKAIGLHQALYRLRCKHQEGCLVLCGARAQAGRHRIYPVLLPL